MIDKYPILFSSNEALKIINGIIKSKYAEIKQILDKHWDALPSRIKKDLSDRKIAYYCFYGFFRNDIIKAVKAKQNADEDRNSYAITCINIIEHNKDIDILDRVAEVIRLIIKYSPQGASDLMLFAKENMRFYHSRKLLIPLINNCSDKYERNMWIHTFNDIIKEMPQLLGYKNIIFAVAKRLLKTDRHSGYDAASVIQWLVTLYWKTKSQNSSLRKKCLNTIDELQIRFGKIIG